MRFCLYLGRVCGVMLMSVGNSVAALTKMVIAPIAISLMIAACSDKGADAPAASTASADAPATAPATSAPALRLSASPGAPSAAYFTLVGDGTAKSVTSVTSPDAGRVEMHESKMEGGMMAMVPITSIDVPASGNVELRPGGKHLMLFDVAEAARTAGSVRLELHFADGTTQALVATSAAMAAMSGGTASAEHGGEHEGGQGGEHSGGDMAH